MSFRKSITLQKALPWILIIGGIVGLLCSFIITIDKFKLLENPSFHPICDLNPILSCGSVMSSAESHVFGFTNSLLGLPAFAALTCIGVSILAGATFKRWFWLGLWAGAALGIVFVHWLIIQSVYGIHALCPFCMVVWVITITTFWYLTLYNIRVKHIVLKGKMVAFGDFIQKHHLDILLFWFLVITVMILKQFWYYYGPLLGFK